MDKYTGLFGYSYSVCFYSAMAFLIGPITGFTRPLSRLSVHPAWALNSNTNKCTQEEKFA